MKPIINITILTNATASRQPSMLGYGRLMLQELPSERHRVTEIRGASFASGRTKSGSKKILRNLDRFLVTPLSLVGKRASILHVVDPGNAIYSSLIRKRQNIVTVHDLIPYLCATGELRGFVPTPAGRLLMKAIIRSLKLADRLVVPSNKTAVDLQRIADISTDKIRVIPNALFQPMQRATDGETALLRRKYRLSDDAPLILHIGRNFYKNRETVISVFDKVAAESATAQLVLVGALEPSVKSVLLRSSFKARIKVIEYIEETDLPTLYTSASVLLFPSIYEGFGYPVLEAQMCGTPVVCSDGGSLPEIAADGASIRPVEDVDGLAQSVLAVISDPKHAHDLTTRGRLNAARFSVRAWRNAHYDLYDELSR